MKVFIIQPPLLQLNTPYPSGAYLKSFFTGLGADVKWKDGSIALFYKIFCRDGLELLYEKSKKSALKLASQALKSGDENTSSVILNFINNWPSWLNYIEKITAILAGGGQKSGREFCHSFVFSPHAPRGPRSIAFLENLEREAGIDDARFLATMALADLADYITAVFDPDFALVRYAENLSISRRSFSQIEAGIDSPVLKNYWQPLVEDYCREIEEMARCESEKKVLVCLSVPFPGTFAAALYAGRFIKEKFGNRVFVSIGGGFINTELRNVSEKSFYKYADALSYDRGYGSYKELMESGLLEIKNNSFAKSLYKMTLFFADSIIQAKEEDLPVQKYEDAVTSELTPDFSEIDFSIYPRMADDTNPMQRLWSDGAWIKAYLAHGCYWHKCAFCDVTLDYVCAYRPCKTEKIFSSLYSQAREKGVYGIHFVDEALPPMQTSRFAYLNASKGSPLSYWGNVRFEKVFTRDMTDFLSYGGLIGVSGGIEIATGSGLSDIDKGTDIQGIVAACCAFKESGILVHAYMIYGWWNESETDLINSMETLRQLYQAGLLDSSFWHKFTLTRHSRVYTEWKAGLHKNLHPIEDKDSGIFAKNGLHFEGEEKSAKFGQGLNAALTAWMHGNSLSKSVNKWFNFKTPNPTVPRDLVERAVIAYEKERDGAFAGKIDVKKCWWLAGNPLVFSVGREKTVCWTYMQEEYKLPVESFLGDCVEDLLNDLWALRPSAKDSERISSINRLESLLKEGRLSLQEFRGRGLVQLKTVI